VLREAVMKTFYEFRSEADPDLHGFTDEVSGSKLPSENGPWTFIRQLASEGEWPSGISKAVTVAGVLENGFSLSNYRAAKPIIASDRVEGTAVYDPSGSRIGTIRRLMIEKVSGKVLYADITFGGFLGLGEHHHAIPWEKLSYDKGLGGYRTDITAEQVRGAPAFYGDEMVWPDRERENKARDYWRLPPS
jgi:hypothetical protein